MATTIGLGAAIALGGACAKKPAPQPTAEPQETTGASMTTTADCPAAGPGVQVQTTETPAGTEMTFTTSGDTAELRRRVRTMAERMNAHAAMMGGADGGRASMGGMMGRGGMGMHGRGGMMAGDAGPGGARMGMGGMPPVRADVEEVDRGARMRVAPLEPSQRDALHRHMQGWAQMMTQRHECPALAP